MRASHNWLKELTGLDLESSDVAERLTSVGLEVESAQVVGDLSGVVLGEVRGVAPHPSRDKLRVVDVFDGQVVERVVCGAPNVPAPGGRVAFAQVGATLPGGAAIQERALGGVVSRGMLCSERELGIGDESDGIISLSPKLDQSVGARLSEALGLHDVIYEIGLTPNRPDCLGHIGIARELCALFAKRFEMPSVPPVDRLIHPDEHQFPQLESTFSLSRMWSGQRSAEVFRESGFAPVRVEIQAPERCPRYGAALLSNVEIGPSPFWLRYRLHTLGVRAINNVVDVTNAIMLGFGHPIHAFDYDRLHGSRITVRLARAGETMTTLDGQARTLTADDLLICDGRGPVALAGVMGGQGSEITADTKRVLIECAYFDSRTVRRTSKRTGVHTDSSHRFERGVDPLAVRTVLAHAVSMVAEVANGVAVESALDVVAQPYETKHVHLRYARLASILGAEISGHESQSILEQLGCEVNAQAEMLDVALPSFRPDLTREVDLIEEVVRMRGYDTVPSKLPSLSLTQRDEDPSLGFIRRLREQAAAAGLFESINFAFVSQRDLEATRVSTRTLRLANPMTEDRSVLRTSLLPGLCANLKLAQAHQQSRFSQFEVSRVFQAADAGLPNEHYQLAGMLWGARALWFNDATPMDFYDAKGAAECIVRAMSATLLEARIDTELATTASFLHPKRAAALWLAGTRIGVVGELHPDVVSSLDLIGRPVYFAIDVPDLRSACEQIGRVQAHAIAKFPSATRDIAVVVDEALQARDIREVLLHAAGSLAEDVQLFDIYRGEPVVAGKKSLAFHVVYRDPSATLTDKQVDEAHARVAKAAESNFSAALRA